MKGVSGIPMRVNSKHLSGFTLVELLICLAIIGILAVVAIPNLRNGLQRAKQKKTMAQMRSIATAWEAFATDHNAYSAAGAATPAGSINWSTLSTYSYKTISRALSPTYIRIAPQQDGWNTSLEFGVATSTAPGTAVVYGIRSLGSDKKVSESGVYTPGARSRFECDIVYSMGSFISYPEGVQVPVTKSSGGKGGSGRDD